RARPLQEPRRIGPDAADQDGARSRRAAQSGQGPAARGNRIEARASNAIERAPVAAEGDELRFRLIECAPEADLPCPVQQQLAAEHVRPLAIAATDVCAVGAVIGEVDLRA